MQEKKVCGQLKSKCDCGFIFGRKQDQLECPECHEERKKCQKPKPFKWVTDPESGKLVNTGERWDKCYHHGNHKAQVGESARHNKENIDQSSRKSNKRTDEDIQEIFLEKYNGKFTRTDYGFVPKIEQNSNFFNVWAEEADNENMSSLRGEVALLRAYLQFNLNEHGDYPEAKDIRLSSKLIQQISTTITSILELETKMQTLVSVSEVRGLIERIIGVISTADIPDMVKFKLVDDIKLSSGQTR